MIKIITIHAKNAEDFLKNNGIGVLTDFKSSPKVKEAINGELYLEFEYKKTGRYSKYLAEENIIVSPIGYGERQAFRISKTKKVINDSNVYIYVYAKHISYDLVDNELDDVYVQDLNGNSAISWILSHTQYEHKFNGSSDIPERYNARYVSKNPIQAFIGEDENSFIKLWGGEIVRNNFNIQILQRRGEDKGVSIRYRKNLKGITFETDFSNIATRVKPKGYNGIELPEKYVDSLLINNYIHPKIIEKKYEDIKLKENTEDEDGFETIEDCYIEMRKRVKDEYENGLDKPKISATVDFIELSKTEEYQEYKNLEKLCIGDTVHIYIDEFDLEVTEKVISTIYDPILDKYTSFELGKEFSSYTLENKNYEKKIEEVIIPNYLEVAKKNATDLLTTALGGYVVKTRNELFILDNEDINKAQKIWRWNLNGLGYSEEGIKGPYKTAITADGQIVADFITTGTMSVDRIEGLSNTLNEFSKIILEANKMSLIVSNTVDITKEKREENSILELENCMRGTLLELSIRGNNQVFGETILDENTKIDENTTFVGQSSVLKFYTDNICSQNSDDYENGYYAYTNGKKYDSEIYIRNKELLYIEDNFEEIEMNVNEEYRFVNIYFYDENKEYIGDNNSLDSSNRVNNLNSVKIKIPTNTKYMGYIFKNKETSSDSSGISISANEIEDINPIFRLVKEVDFGITERLRTMDKIITNEDGTKSISTVYDELLIKNNIATLIRRIGQDVDNNWYILENEECTDLFDITINLIKGSNYIQLLNYKTEMYAKYVITNEFTDLFATSVEMNAAINILTNSIKLMVSQNDIISAINVAIENEQGVINIKTNQLTIDSDLLKLTAEGHLTTKSGQIGNWILSANHLYYTYSVDNSKYESGLFARENGISSDIFLYAGLDVTSGNNSLSNANTYITHEGRMFAKWFDVNGENGYFRVKYDNGNVAMLFDKHYLNRYLSNGNRWTCEGVGLIDNTPYCHTIWLYDSLGFGVESGIHGTTLMRIYRVDNSGASAHTDFWTDVKVWGNRMDGINNSMYIQGYEVATNASDRRLKKNIKLTKYKALEFINKLEICEFDWRKPRNHKRKHITFGFIAQQAKSILTSLVNYNKEHDTYQMDPLNVSALNTKGIQEVYKMLENEIKKNEEKDKIIKKQEQTIFFMIDKMGCKEELEKYLKHLEEVEDGQ